MTKQDKKLYLKATAGEFLGISLAEISFPHPQLSISHTGDRLACIYIPTGQGVGVDIETQRQTTPRLRSKLLSQTEQENSELQHFSALQLWCIKEALFKANMQNAGTYIPQYQLLSRQHARLEDKLFTFAVRSVADLHLAVAVSARREA